MKIRRKISIFSAVIFLLLIILASMNVAMHRGIVQNQEIRDSLKAKRERLEKYEAWKNDCRLLVSVIISSGRVPKSLGKVPHVPDGIDQSRIQPIYDQVALLIALVDKKNSFYLDSEKLFDQIRGEITSLYHELDKKIATVLADIQLDQILETSDKEKASLPPYVLKSLNQLTLVALNSLVTRQYSKTDQRIVSRNRQFLEAQVKEIDSDGSIQKLFASLLNKIDNLEKVLPECQKTMLALNSEISKQREVFEQTLRVPNGKNSLKQAETEVAVADRNLKQTSQRTFIVSIVFLCVVPALAMFLGIWGLHRLVTEPLSELISIMEKFRQGDMEALAPVHRNDEIGALAETFNSMAGQIRAKVKDLSTLNKALRDNESRLHAILESNSNPFIVYDMDRVPQYVNPAFVEVFGWELAELQNEGVRDIPADQKELNEQKFHEIQNSGAAAKFISKRYTKDGDILDVIVGAANIKGADSSYMGMVVNLADISEQKSLQEQLAQSQKMESVGRLAGGVAHDFNNMLGVILGYVDHALLRVKPDDPLYNNFKQIEAAATRSAEITRQLLAFSRKQTIAPQKLNLNESIENTLKILKRLLGENIELNWKPRTLTAPVYMDPTQVDQILVNLCVNSRDAIKDTGLISIETSIECVDRSYTAKHTEFPVKDFVLLSVSDNGCGMDKETQEHMFEPFYTTKKQGEGTGLGMAMVYGIVKQNDGFINCYSEPGQGTTFRIYLPLDKSSLQVHPDENEAVLKEDLEGKETILLVEDEQMFLDITAQMLEDLGYNVLPCTSAAEAQKLSREYEGQIDLLITDVVMPEVSGRELAELLQVQHSKLGVLFMSGYTADIIAHRGVLNKGINFISKPFNQRTLAMKVREILEA